MVYDLSRLPMNPAADLLFRGARSDPVKRQGPDVDTSYRSAIFYENDNEKRIAEAYIAQLNAAHLFARPMPTR